MKYLRWYSWHKIRTAVKTQHNIFCIFYCPKQWYFKKPKKICATKQELIYGGMRVRARSFKWLSDWFAARGLLPLWWHSLAIFGSVWRPVGMKEVWEGSDSQALLAIRGRARHERSQPDDQAHYSSQGVLRGWRASWWGNELKRVVDDSGELLRHPSWGILIYMMHIVTNP